MKRRRGFSLIELLLAIFILGIGVIGIAALFPAGIVLQRQSVDDIVGPTVAENALALLRAKVRREDFGRFEDFGSSSVTVSLRAPRFSIEGDWPWLRPGVILDDDTSTNDIDERGMLDIFSALWTTTPEPAATEFPNGYDDGVTASSPTLYGVPYNLNRPRAVYVTREERYYPTVSQFDASTTPARPQYYWDCMFRRFNGRIYVAIFVYRITSTGEAVEWAMPVNTIDAEIPALPQKLDFVLADQVSTMTGPWDAFGPDLDLLTRGDNRIVLGTDGGETYDPTDPVQAWQEPGQWIIDQNNNVHRVLSSGRYDTSDGVFADDSAEPYAVELLEAVPQAPVGLNAFGSSNPVYIVNTAPSTGAVGVEDVVSDVWYMPIEVELDNEILTLTPVYAMVREL